MERPSADVSVRVAWAADAPAVAVLQVRAWRERYADLLPADVLEELPLDAFTLQWEQSIARPKEARQRVLVALERTAVRGFAATAPATDADADPARDAELTEFIVDLDSRRVGHGSRLLHAVADTLRSDRFTRATVWVVQSDDEVREFFLGQGWAADGAHRELDLYGDGAVVVEQVRLHTDVTSTP
jgi:GNAT superfamily N-acetyltransferase